MQYKIDTSLTHGLSVTPLKELISIQDAIHKHVPMAQVQSDLFAHLTSILKGVLVRGEQRSSDLDNLQKAKFVLEREGYNTKLDTTDVPDVYALTVVALDEKEQENPANE